MEPMPERSYWTVGSANAILAMVSMLAFAGVAVLRLRSAVRKEAWLKKGMIVLRAALSPRALRVSFLPDERGGMPESVGRRMLSLYCRSVLTILFAIVALALGGFVASACRLSHAPFLLVACAGAGFKLGGEVKSLLGRWAQAEKAVFVAVTLHRGGCLDARERRFAAFLIVSSVVLFSCPAVSVGVRSFLTPLLVLVLAAIFSATGVPTQPDTLVRVRSESPLKGPCPDRAPAWFLEEVAEMCKKVGMECVDVEIAQGFECECEEGGLGEKPVLRVGREFVQDFGDRRQTRFALAHEIAHLSSCDHSRVPLVRSVLAVADFALVAGCFACAVATAHAAFQQRDSHLTNYALVMASSGAFFMFVGSVACNKRYWQGVAELRAGRRALEISGCSVGDVAKVLGCGKAREAERDLKAWLEEGGPMASRSKKRRISEAYLPIDYRIEFVSRPWGVTSYARHFLFVKSWLFQGKGWTGL